jgi:MFS family permease
VQHQSRRLAWTSAVIHGLVHASVLMLPPLLGDLSRAFHVPLLAVLTVANAMYLVYGLCAVPAGFLADRFGSRRMLVIAAAGCTVSLLLVAGAPSFPVLAAGLILLGLSAGVYHPSGLSLLSRGVATGERGRAIGIHGAGGNFGEALAPAWAGLFASTVGWRFGFVAAAALSLACAVLAAGLPATEPAERGHAAGPPRGRSLRATFRALGRTLAGFAGNRPLLLLLFSLVASGFVYRGFLTFLSMHLAEAGGMGARSSYLMSAVLVAGIIAQRFGGELVDRRSGERLYLLETIPWAPSLVLLALAPGPAAAVAGALMFGFCWALTQPVANALTAEYARSGEHGLLYGIQFAATFGIGSFATTAGGYLLSRGGTRAVFLGLAAVAVAGGLAVAALLALRRRNLMK